MVKDLDSCEEKPRAERATPRFGSETERIQRNEAGARLIAKVLRTVLAAEKFSAATDLRDAVEDRCRTLGLAFNREQMERAMDLVGSNTQLLQANQQPAMVAPPIDPPRPEISATDATAILDSLGVDVRGGRLKPKNTRPSRLEAL